MPVPPQRPGNSRQDWQTPPELITAVKHRIHNDFAFDLAASDENVIGEIPYYTEEDDALSKSWADIQPLIYDNGCTSPWLWLNPPYSNIRPWVAKCAYESLQGAHIACLVPASTGSNWWCDHVVNDAYVLFLNGRITFVGATAPYPKDCALLLYTPFIRSGSAVWNWRS